MADPGRDRGKPRRHGPRWLRLVAPVVVAALVLAGAYTWLARIYTVSTSSMRPTLETGDRVLAIRIDRDDLRRGDVVVVDVRGSWAQPGSGDEPIAVKRVVGLPGERVACCDPYGRVTVDGRSLDESYLAGHEGGAGFEVVVPEGRLWLLGDDRANSVDSRDHLGAPGGGSVAIEDVEGRVVAVVWPPVRAVDRPAR
jgi:signal peptidase I